MAVDLVIIGLVIALEPIPLTAFVLLRLADRGAQKSAAFILGWAASLVAVVAITLLATGNHPPAPNTAPSVVALTVKILIGIGLLVVAERRRRIGGFRKPHKTPKWQMRIDSMSPWYAAVLAFLIQPWGIVAAGVAVIIEAKLSSWQSWLIVIVFCLVSTSSFLAIELYAALRPEASRSFLLSLRSWIDSHTNALIVVLSAGLGSWLVGYSTYLLIT